MKRAEEFVGHCEGLGVRLTTKMLADLSWFLEELLRWNASINLTAITDPQEAQVKHLLDSLTIVSLIEEGRSVLDMGSGGGFPGLPMKIVRDDIRILSVDSVQKKIAFQKHVVRSLGLKRFEAWHGRVEQVSSRPDCGEGFDWVVSRAFSALDTFVNYALPCLKNTTGRILAMKGPEGEAELRQAEQFLTIKGLRCEDLRTLELPKSGGTRTLIILGRI